MPPAPISALIVDDVAAVRRYISQILQQMGITSVLEAADGNSATQLFRQHQPQLVFLDIQLPDVSGQLLLKQFKQQQQHTHTLQPYLRPHSLLLCSPGPAARYLADARQNRSRWPRVCRSWPCAGGADDHG